MGSDDCGNFYQNYEGYVTGCLDGKNGEKISKKVVYRTHAFFARDTSRSGNCQTRPNWAAI